MRRVEFPAAVGFQEMEDGSMRVYLSIPGKAVAAAGWVCDDLLLRAAELGEMHCRAANIMDEIPAGALALVDERDNYMIRKPGAPLDRDEHEAIHDDDRVGRAEELEPR